MPYERRLDADELWELRWGHLPQNMDDKWGCFYRDGVLHIYCSWTGNCIYKLRLNPGGKHEVQVCNDPEVYLFTTDVERDTEILDYLLDLWLAPVDLPMSM